MKSTRGVKHDLNSLSQATRQVRKPLAETEKTQNKHDWEGIITNSVLNGKSWR